MMNNGKINLGKIVIEIIEEVGASLLFLSPYSPEFSPIENFFSKAKAILRRVKVRNYQGLIDAMTSAIFKVSQKDIRN
ncbi:transposase [Trichodesmium erythraeum]|nr:transposase [Trichodesmium sp. St11_bin5]